jgi:signal transduction histidine kinase
MSLLGCTRVVLKADDWRGRSAYSQHVSLVRRLISSARSLDPRVLDAGVALGLTVWVLAEPGTLSGPGQAFVPLMMTAAVAWCRRAPVAVLAIELVGLVAIPNRLNWPAGVAFLIAAYSAAFYSDRRVVVALLLLATAAWLFAFGGQVNIPSGLVPLLLVAPVWLAGSAMRRREQRAEASAERADRLEREREAALRAERTRIARELHDLVTHSVSVMVLQTGAARQIMSQDESRSRAMLESVEASGRSALEELRHLLGLLPDQDGAAPLSPQPGVTEIPSLIEHVQQAGVDVELCVAGQPRPVSSGVAVAAYRIVQEALTNVLKHADGAPTRVDLHWTGGALELEILDQGPRHDDARQDAHAGRGLAGMRERAAMYGGTLEAHPCSERGYLVRAHLPLERTEA